MDYTNQYVALRQVGELDDNRQRLLAAKTELDDATKRYQDAKQAYDQAYTALRFFEPDVKERQQSIRQIDHLKRLWTADEFCGGALLIRTQANDVAKYLHRQRNPCSNF